ncbi:MAG: extracellular solute-binding protein [Anaerolineae bacterium]|nr:extracellular solute-binding protein [Anaerolineae bacterium]
MFRLRLLIILVIASLAFGSLFAGHTPQANAQGDTFFGKTAKELFPDSPEKEQQAAFKALLAANIPDGHALGEGKTITVATLGQGARGGISGVVYFFRNAFEAATGAKLDIVEVPFGQLGTTIPTDFQTEQHTYDAIVNAAWFYGDYVTNGWIQPVDKWIGDKRFPSYDPNDIAPALRNLYQWGGKTYGVVMDGDAQLFYYRRDILGDKKWQDEYKKATGEDLPNPPKTWQQLLKVMTFFSGKDWNGDGDPDDGISLHLKVGGQGMFHFMTLSAGFAVTPGPSDDPRKVTKTSNVYWFDPDTMDPIINGPGQVAALEFLQKLAATGQKAQFGWELGEAWQNFFDGNAIATFSWGDVGSISQDETKSKIKGKLGSSRILCSEEWYDLSAKKMVTDAAKPNCVGNTIGGSWHGTISAFSKNPELAYYFLALMGTPKVNFFEQTTGWMGTDPCCTYSLFPPQGKASIDDFVAFGFNKDDFNMYIPAYADNLFSFPTYLTYLRIPGTPAYWTALDVRLSEAMTGQKNAKDALDATAEDFKKITADAGVDKQLKIYQESIGYTPGK